MKCADCGGPCKRRAVRCRACHDAATRARPGTPVKSMTPRGREALQGLVEDIQFLVDGGMRRPEEIAERLGVQLNSLRRRFARHGVDADAVFRGEDITWT